MTASRCPACAAAVRPDDPWCTLCFADLRAPVAVAAGQQAAATEPELLQPLPVPLQPASAVPATDTVGVDPADPLGLAPARPRWSCPCGAHPTYDELVCSTCGHALLATADPELPLSRIAQAPKAAVMLGGALVVTGVLVVLFTVVGLLL